VTESKHLGVLHKTQLCFTQNTKVFLGSFFQFLIRFKSIRYKSGQKLPKSTKKGQKLPKAATSFHLDLLLKRQTKPGRNRMQIEHLYYSLKTKKVCQ